MKTAKKTRQNNAKKRAFLDAFLLRQFNNIRPGTPILRTIDYGLRTVDRALKTKEYGLWAADCEPNIFTTRSLKTNPNRVLNAVRIWILLSTLLVASGWILSAFHELNPLGYGAAFALAAVLFLVWKHKTGWRPRKNISQLFHKFTCRFKRPAPFLFLALAAMSFLAGALCAWGALGAQTSLPAAPGPQVISPVQLAQAGGNSAAPQAKPYQSPPPIQLTSPEKTPPASELPSLTREQAEAMAIRNNPRVSVGRLQALAQHEVYREARAAELPTANAAITGVEGEEASRISAGSLTSSRILEHAGAGAEFTQLIYDFGHTHNLVLSRKFAEQASNASALATTEEIVLATDQAFYDALTAQAVLEVARQTVNSRQTTDTQVNQMTRNKLKSTLDLSFADVDLSQAQLMQLDAQNNADASMATLDAVLGLDHNVQYRLVEDTAAPPPPAPSAEPLIQTALRQRPDLQSLNYNTTSAQKYARAEWDQMLPSISAEGTAGTVPIRADRYYTADYWAGIGGNMSIPLFNGFLYTSQAREAKYRAQAAAEDSRDLRDRIVRDVRTAWLQANNNWQRMAVTAQLVREADMSLKLAQTRYQMGLSSIVELTQAQLQQTSAQIQDTNARYQYRLSLATLNYEMGTAP